MGADTSVSNQELAEKLDALAAEVHELVSTMRRFLPLLESYEQAKKANGFLAARRALKG